MMHPLRITTAALRRRGFTLLELLVVILIIGLLTGIVAPRFLGRSGAPRSTAARAQLDAFDKALQAYRIDTGPLPDDGARLARAGRRSRAEEARWRGPYLQGRGSARPVGQRLSVPHPGCNSGKDYDLLSYGKDRAPGGTGDDADIVR